MPDLTGNIEEIQNSLKASLGRGQSNLDQNVVAASKRVLLQSIEFKPASAPLSLQCNALKSKYTLLNPSSSSKAMPWNGTAEHQQVGKDTQRTAMEGGSEELLPRPKVVLYPEEMIKMEWTSRTGCRIGAGLVNMGNTCFFNSTLQCLTYTAPLVNYCMSGDHRQKCKKNGFCMMCEIQAHIRTSLECGGRSIKPHSMLQKLRCIAKHMKWGRQEDAHEFLRFVVDHLQQSCLAGENKGLDRHSKETTVINQIFGGYLRSQVTCLRCQAKSNTFDPFMDLSLDIKGVNTVEDALAKFVKPETLENENAYKCPKCRHKVRAHKRFSIQKPPNILTLQLNRFDFHRHLSGKINRFIKYPERINLRNFMSQKQGEPILYHLYGVLVHSGHSSDCGHYYSYVKSPNKTWYCMNDSMVHQANYQSVFSADAYVLFYARVNRSSSVPSTPKNDYVKQPFTPSKNSFIGPVMPNKSPLMNGVHGKTSSDASSQAQREQKVLPGTPKIVSHASSLPDSHRKISFPILTTSQQKKLQHQQSSQRQQDDDDGNRIVLQIKHGNSTTMLKSPDGKSKVVNGSVSTLPWNQQPKSGSGLVPYNDNDDSDSEQENKSSQSVAASSHHSSKVTNSSSVVSPMRKQPHDHHHQYKTKPSSSSSIYENNTTPPSLVNGGGDNLLSHKKGVSSPSKSPSASENSLASSSKSSTIIPNRHSSDSQSGKHSYPSPSPSPVNSFHKSSNSSDSGRHNNNSNSNHKQTTSTSSSSRPHLSLDLPNTSAHKVKSCGGTWFISPHEGAPSPRGSNSSTNSVNSTSEWMVESKGGVKVKPAKDSKDVSQPLIINCSSNEDKPNGSGRLSAASSPPPPSKHRLVPPSHKPSMLSGQSHSPLPESKLVSKYSPRNGDATPVDISDKQLLLSPASSQSSESGPRKLSKLFKTRKRKHEADSRERSLSPIYDEASSSKNGLKKKKKKKMKHKKEKEGKRTLVSNSDSDDSESIPIGSKAKKHKKEKEDRKRLLPDSDSEDSDVAASGKSKKHKREKEVKRKHYSSNSSDNGEKVSANRKKGKSKERKRSSSSSSSGSEDAYEWVEKTIVSPLSKGGKVNPVCEQSWNQHVKDDLHKKKEEADGKSKKATTWDGTRHSKVHKELENSFDYKNRVVSWDGGKSQLSKDLEESRKVNRMQEMTNEYDQEMDAGKVKKVKNRKEDTGRGSSYNAFQQFNNFKNKNCEENGETSWSRDHSYFDRRDDVQGGHNYTGNSNGSSYGGDSGDNNNKGYNRQHNNSSWDSDHKPSSYHKPYNKHNGSSNSSKFNGNRRYFN